MNFGAVEENSVKQEPIDQSILKDAEGYSIAGTAVMQRKNDQGSMSGKEDTEGSRTVMDNHYGFDYAQDQSGAATGSGGVTSIPNAAAAAATIAEGQIVPEQPDLRIIKRQISGYVGFANLPKQWYRKSIRNGFNFNLLCVGTNGLGKTTLVNSLFNQSFPLDKTEPVEDLMNNLEISNAEEEHSKDADKHSNVDAQGSPLPNDLNQNSQENGLNGVKIETRSANIIENGVKLKLTVIDSPGFGDSIDNSDAWEPIVKEIDYRYDQFLDAENRINRSTIEDQRVHACIYFIEPTGHYLKPLDLEFCRQVHEKCNLIPVIAKSDILSDDELETFKLRIKKQLEEAGIQLFKPPTYKIDDEETLQTAGKLYSKMPYAVVGSTDLVQSAEGKMVRGRQYPWGIIEVDNPVHSDFNDLRDLLIRKYLEELRERTSKVLYEKYRSEKLVRLGIKQDNSVFREFDPQARRIEEQKLHEAKLNKLETEMKTVFQQKVSEKEKKLQKSEAELFARHKEMKEKLTKQLKALETKKKELESSLTKQLSQSPVQPKKKGFLR